MFFHRLSWKKFAPTGNVELYFDQQDITEEYQVMGMLNADAPEIISTWRIQERIVEKAHEMGADAVLFEFQDKRVNGSSTNRNQGNYGEYSYTLVSENKIISAKFLKFNKA